MKHKLLKTLFIGLTVCSMFFMSNMLTQDDLGDFYKEANKLIESGVSKEEMAGIITHTAFYVGWPKGWAVFNLAKEVYKD